MRKQILSYHCLKCGNPQNFEVRKNMQQKSIDVIREGFDSKLCLACIVDKQDKIEETAENLRGLLC